MGKSKFYIQERFSIMAEHEADTSVAELCRKHETSSAVRSP